MQVSRRNLVDIHMCFNFDDSLKIIEHWQNEDISFENRLHDLVKRLIYGDKQ